MAPDEARNCELLQGFWDCGFKNVYPLAALRVMKDVGRRIREQRELREQFLEACKSQDKPAAQVLREFMRAYVQQAKSRNDREQPLKKHV